MPPVGLESTISVLERAKTVHALDRAATVSGISASSDANYFSYTYIPATAVFHASKRYYVTQIFKIITSGSPDIPSGYSPLLHNVACNKSSF
jgi:hypothetical protein